MAIWNNSRQPEVFLLPGRKCHFSATLPLCPKTGTQLTRHEVASYIKHIHTSCQTSFRVSLKVILQEAFFPAASILSHFSLKRIFSLFHR